MISKELIDSDLGIILVRLGKPVCNSALYKQELMALAPSDKEILAEHEVLLKEREVADAAKEEERSKVSAYSQWLANGFDSGLGYSLAISTEDQNAFSNLMVALNSKSPKDDSLWVIKDINGDKREVSYKVFKDISNKYFDYVYKAWQSF